MKTNEKLHKPLINKKRNHIKNFVLVLQRYKHTQYIFETLVLERTVAEPTKSDQPEAVLGTCNNWYYYSRFSMYWLFYFVKRNDGSSE